MKKISTLSLMLMLLFAVGCSKDDEVDNFDYSMDTLYGTWRITHVEQNDGSMFDVTTALAEKVFEPTYATFNKNGTYTGKGFFGNGAGTYKAKGKTLTCYIDGEVFLMYDVLNLKNNECTLLVREEGSTSTVKIQCKKQ